MHYTGMVVTSITVQSQPEPGCNSCNYIHYMTNYMLPKVLMVCNCKSLRRSVLGFARRQEDNKSAP